MTCRMVANKVIGRDRGGGGYRVRGGRGGVDGWKTRERESETVMNSPTGAEKDIKRRPADFSWGDSERNIYIERERGIEIKR